MIVASNRGPYTFKGEKVIRSSGGLVSALEPILRAEGGTWIAWPGTLGEIPRSLERKIPAAGYNFSSVFLTYNEYQNYYLGFSNEVLWPLCHGLTQYCSYKKEYWQDYVRVNKKFARQILSKASFGETVWINDYHLALVPLFLHQKRRDLNLLFFWHIPFPAPEIWDTLPWGKHILKSLALCDRVGFHTTEYKRNFLACLEYEELRTRAHIQANPISVDYEYYRNAASQLQSRSFANVWRSKAKTPILIIGIDRQDYTKGIPQKIKALELLFSRNPKWRGRLTFIQVMVPSRQEIEAYDEVKRETYQSVYELNSRFGKKDYLPVQLIYRSLDFYELMGLYLAGDIALVTPIKDGLNLVAKEYITCHLGKEGVLVLSKGAGAAAELKDAVLVDASDTLSIAEGIEKALTMSSAEKRKRFANLKKEVQQHDLFHWRNIFLGKAITVPASIFRAKS